MKQECSEQNLSQCLFFHHKSYTDWPGIKCGPLLCSWRRGTWHDPNNPTATPHVFPTKMSVAITVIRLVKVKWSHYRPGVAQRVGSGIAVLFHDRGTRRGQQHAPAALYPRERPGTHFTGGWSWRSGRAENLVPTGIRSRTFQPLASRYTNWTTRPTFDLVQSQYHNEWLRTFIETRFSKMCSAEPWGLCDVSWVSLRVYKQLNDFRISKF